MMGSTLKKLDQLKRGRPAKPVPSRARGSASAPICPRGGHDNKRPLSKLHKEGINWLIFIESCLPKSYNQIPSLAISPNFYLYQNRFQCELLNQNFPRFWITSGKLSKHPMRLRKK